MSHEVEAQNTIPLYDQVISTITDYVYSYEITSEKAFLRARIALLDSIACAFEGIPACSSFMGPTVSGTIVPYGFPLPGTTHVLEPLKAAFDLGSLIRYLDHNDAYPGAEWGHPSDNIGAILPVADWLSRQGKCEMTMDKVLEAVVKAYEIQGVFQRNNAFNKVGLDHVILVKIASTAVLSKLVGLTKHQANEAISQAFADGHPLRIYRQGINTSPRKGWAAGDACMRAVHLVLMTKSGQPGFPTVLTDVKWGFYKTYFGGETEFTLASPFGTHVIENHFFKIHPAEGHAISAVEAAVQLSKTLAGRLNSVHNIHIRTQAPAMTITNKTGPLRNAADRDHCMQYMVALTLMKGDWPEIKDYEDVSPFASDAKLDELRGKITMEEDPEMTKDYYSLKVAKCASSLTVTMEDGQVIPTVLVERPVGHPWREDTVENVKAKFVKLSAGFLDNPSAVWDKSLQEDFAKWKVRDWVDQFAGR